MKGFVINNNSNSFYQNQNGIYYPIPILSGKYIGKFFLFENSIDLFPEIFENSTYEIVDLDASALQINTTPPTLMPFAVIIPEVYQWVFDNGVFALNGFEVPLDTNGNNKVVNMAYFMWQEFRNELDKKDSNNRFIHETLKNSLMPLWDYVKLHGDTIGPWMQDPQNNALSDKVVIL